MKSAVAASLLFAPLALAATHSVKVGPGLDYSPDSLTAASGDVVEFTFGSGHNVVSGSFDNPCQPSGGIYSGDPDEGAVFSVTINSTDPLWIYCSVPRHCQGGMAMVINPPSSGNTLDAYKSAARSVDSSSQPSNIEGGVFGAASGSGSSSSSASAVSSSAAVAASSASASVISSATGSGSSASASASSAASAAGSSASSAVVASATSSTSSGFAAPTLMSDLSKIAGAIVGGLALAL